MIPATEGVLRLQMKSKSSIPCTARGCRPLNEQSVDVVGDLEIRASGGLLDEASCLVIEEHVVGSWAQRPTGSSKAPNVVVCGCASRSRAVTVRCAIGLRCRSARHWRAVGSRGRHDEDDDDDEEDDRG